MKKITTKDRWIHAGHWAVGISTGLVGLVALEAVKGVVKLVKKKDDGDVVVRVRG